MISEPNKRLLALSKLRGIGPATLQNIAATPSFADCSVSTLAAKNPKLAKALEPAHAWENALAAAEEDLGSCERYGARILSVLDDDYPRLLRLTQDRPFFLYALGRFAANPKQSLAIIGTRDPTEHGSVIAKRLTSYFLEQGWSIVSGLALGCDAIAHQTSLDQGGHTVAVLAHGLQTVAPKQNERLAKRILDSGGALVTEYAFGVAPIPPYFVKRDRIQAGLASGVVMVQSALNGGSLHASRAAIEYGRILAVPAPTERDNVNKEPKVAANRTLTGESDSEKAALLNCRLDDLRRVFALRSKDDYATLNQSLSDVCLSLG